MLMAQWVKGCKRRILGRVGRRVGSPRCLLELSVMWESSFAAKMVAIGLTAAQGSQQLSPGHGVVSHCVHPILLLSSRATKKKEGKEHLY